MILKNTEVLLTRLSALAAQSLAVSALLNKARTENRDPTDEEMAALSASLHVQAGAATNRGPIWGNL